MVFRVSNGVLEGGKATSNDVSFLALLLGEHAGAPSTAWCRCALDLSLPVN